MSSTIIYGFNKEGNTFFFDETKNAFRGAWATWREMEIRHLPPTFMGISRTTNPEKVKEIWNLADRKDIPLHERIVLHTTFDKCLVKAEDIPKVIDAFRKFGGTTSLPEQADILEKLPEGTIAVGWNQSSVNCDDWSGQGGYDEENDEAIPYNCLTMNEHYWLFDELEV